MRYLEFKKQFSAFIIFSIRDIRKVWPDFDNRRLVEWQAQGYIKKIIKTYYIFADLDIDEKGLFLIANEIYKPSYISLETALSYYGIIPEGVYTITSITTNKTQQFETTRGNFVYQSIKPSLYFGYKLLDYQNQKIRIAELEKTILDFLYLHPEIEDSSHIMGLRFNQDELYRTFDEKTFNDYLKIFDNRALEHRASVLLAYIKLNYPQVETF